MSIKERLKNLSQDILAKHIELRESKKSMCPKEQVAYLYWVATEIYEISEMED